jgi:putative flippase GtrA
VFDLVVYFFAMSTYPTVTIKTLYFLARYGISGLIGGGIQIFADYVYVDILNRWYMEGVVVGFLSALIVVFTLQKYWTFGDSSRVHAKRQFFWYTVISLWSLVANVACMYIFVSVYGLWHIFAQCVTIVIVAGTSLFFNICVTFKKPAT